MGSGGAIQLRAKGDTVDTHLLAFPTRAVHDHAQLLLRTQTPLEDCSVWGHPVWGSSRREWLVEPLIPSWLTRLLPGAVLITESGVTLEFEGVTSRLDLMSEGSATQTTPDAQARRIGMIATG